MTYLDAYVPTPEEQAAIDEAVATLTAKLHPQLAHGEYLTSDGAWEITLSAQRPLEVPSTIVLDCPLPQLHRDQDWHDS